MSVYNLIGQNAENILKQFDLETEDPSLNSLMAPPLLNQYNVDEKLFNQLFLTKYNIEYISSYFLKNKKPVRVLSFPKATNTCYEKAEILIDWNPLNVIKAFYLETPDDGLLYAIIVPETGCFLDRNLIRMRLNLPENMSLIRATHLPKNMSFGSCSPFIQKDDLIENGGKVKRIVFDKEALVLKRYENSLDDFSFGLEHRLSIQMNYYHCYQMLREMFADVVIDREVLSLSFKERIVRKKGRVKIDYEFKSLNYRTALFMNNIHGYGDVSIINDHVDELFIPEVLTTQQANSNET